MKTRCGIVLELRYGHGLEDLWWESYIFQSNFLECGGRQKVMISLFLHVDYDSVQI